MANNTLAIVIVKTWIDEDESMFYVYGSIYGLQRKKISNFYTQNW